MLLHASIKYIFWDISVTESEKARVISLSDMVANTPMFEEVTILDTLLTR